MWTTKNPPPFSHIVIAAVIIAVVIMIPIFLFGSR